MKTLGMMLLFGVAACTTPGIAQEAASGAAVPATPAPFAGSWESCQGASAPEECARYVLVQRGRRVCGTWFYVASGQAYQGRVVAHAISPTQARRTHVCGRPGSETGTECDDGWESIDRPLLLCGGGLADLVRKDGSCMADYRPVGAAEGDVSALLIQPWVQQCLLADR